jgi:hypothetical protein
LSYWAAVAWWKSEQPTAEEEARYKERSREQKAIQAADEALIRDAYRIDSLECRRLDASGEWAVGVSMRGARTGRYRLYLNLTMSGISKPLDHVERVLDLDGRPAFVGLRYRMAALESTYCLLWDSTGTQYAYNGTDFDLGATLVPLDLDSAQAQRLNWRLGSKKDIYVPVSFHCPAGKVEDHSDADASKGPMRGDR